MRTLGGVLAVLFGLLMGAMLFAPAVLLSNLASSASRGAIQLASPSGSLWNGSAQVQFRPERLGGDVGAKPQAPIAVPGRLAWQLGWSWVGGLELWLQGPQISGAITQQPIRLGRWWTGRPTVEVPDGVIRLPHMNLRHATGPLALFRPDFKPSLAWAGVRSEQLQDLRVTLTLDDLGSAISPIRPLGSYRISIAPDGGVHKAWSWRLESAGSPVISLSGEGRLDQMVRGNLRMQCMRSCEFVGGILSAVGKQNGEIYEAQLGL